jgi:hypothetical protein
MAEEKIKKICVFEVGDALKGVPTFTAWVPFKLSAKLSAADQADQAVLEMRIPFRVFFSEKHRVAAMYPALLTLPLPQKYNAVFHSPGIIFVGTSISPREFREAVENELGWYNIRPTPLTKPIVFPIPNSAAADIVNELKMKKLSGWDSRFDAFAYFFIEPNRKVMIYRFANYRADRFEAYLILYRDIKEVPDIAFRIDRQASKGIEEALQNLNLM